MLLVLVFVCGKLEFVYGCLELVWVCLIWLGCLVVLLVGLLCCECLLC